MTINGASSMPESVTGIQLAQGIGVQEARGFWADAWAQVLRRPGAVAALGWLGIVAFFAVTAPFLASGHPLVLRTVTPEGPGLLGRRVGPGAETPRGRRGARLARDCGVLRGHRAVPGQRPSAGAAHGDARGPGASGPTRGPRC